MRLPVVMSFCLGIGGCTLSPTTVNIQDPRYTPVISEGATSVAPYEKEDWEAHLGEFPPQKELPQLPTFTDRELNDPDLVERKLVGHIGQLREHITSYYADVDDYERSLLETFPQ